MAAPASTLVRDRVTAVVGGAYVLIGASTASLGPVGDELRRSLHLSSAVTGLHGALFGWFLLACALLSAWLRRLASTGVLLRAAVVAMGVGLVVLASADRVALTLLGAACTGLGGAVTVLVSPQIVAARHGESGRAAAFTYVNALSQIGSIAAPLVLALSLHQRWGWRWPVGAFGAVGATLVLVGSRHAELPQHADAITMARTGAVALLRRHPAVRLRWLTLALGIAVEFATLFWAAASVRELAHTSSATASVGVGLFAGGMVVGRLAGPRLVAHFDGVTILRTSFVVATAAAVVLRVGPGVPARLLALAAMGLGLALVYPVAFSRLYGVGVADADVGAVGALASGSAVTFSPLVLGALADASSLRWALLTLPALCLAGLLALSTSVRSAA